ncbi:MAG: VCBS repeat-containing protein [Planctomycetes bacterium]|nr:VCBS repeat-containing protein [Planctomycetota bacterium]
MEAADGQLRWAFETGGAIERSPAAADMDGDGWLDLVVTSHSRKIACVSGKGRLPR